NDLYQRWRQHREHMVDGFTAKYNCEYLIYFEDFTDINEAIHREKELKGWTRDKKLELIRKQNPWLKDFGDEFGWTR
ncbi:MAG: GIY-YIG nuclease family protein, partial [Bacteroidales bacterium]|nr:GIY-YIG nuclease family protein [Bacteroidales bacterium]